MSLFADALSIKRSFYEGGKIHGANADFRNGNTHFEQTASPDRGTIQSRARWLHENNGIVSGIDHSIKVNSFGNGMLFQSKTGINAFDIEVEKKFVDWMKPNNCDLTRRQHFYEMHSTIPGQRMVDGEVLIHKIYTNDKKNPFKIQLIESDRFDTSYMTTGLNEVQNFVDGIELDSFGAPQKYILKNGLMSNVKLNADDVIHYYKRENRITQYRGISEYKQIIIDLRNLAGYQSATIQSLRSRAGIGYAIESTNIAGRIGQLNQTEDQDPIYDINGVMVHYLNQGEKIHMFDPTISGNEYGEFIRSCVRMIATGRKVSYELAFRDYTQTNFSSARASLIQDNKTFANEQWHFATYVLNPIFEAWLEANVLAGNIKCLSASAYFANKSKFTQPRWIAPAKEWVDPLKDIRAFIEEYKLGTATLADFAASKGKDLEEIIKQREKEDAMLKNAGILKEEDVNAKTKKT
jgi:lambda family phage portal protein